MSKINQFVDMDTDDIFGETPEYLSLQNANVSEPNLGESDQDVNTPELQPIANSGKAMKEKEHCIIARVIDFAQMKKANNAEIQEQWGVKVDHTEENAGAAQLRVRKISNANGEVRYEMTTKSLVAEGKIECTIPTTEANFQQFKVIAESGMTKHRYTFNNEDGSKWEVDCTPDGNGGYFPWVRCEIEVSDLDAKIPNLPIKTEEVIMPPKLGGLSQEEFDEKTKPLYDRFFVLKNQYAKDSVATPLERNDASTDDQSSQEFSEGADSDTEVPKETISKEEAEKQNMSIDNITDDHAKADAVEEKAEQIMDARGKSMDDDEDATDEGEADDAGEGDEDSEGTDDGDVDTEDTGDDEPGETDDEDSGDEDDDEKVSQQSYAVGNDPHFEIKHAAFIGYESHEADDDEQATARADFRRLAEEINPGSVPQNLTKEQALTILDSIVTASPLEEELTIQSYNEFDLAPASDVEVVPQQEVALEHINAVKLAMATIRNSGSTDEERDDALSTVRRIYAGLQAVGSDTMDVQLNNVGLAKNAILSHYSRLYDVNDVDTELNEQNLISSLETSLA